MGGQARRVGPRPVIPSRPPEQAAARALSPLALFGLISGPLLVMLDSGVVNVAVPDIARDLHASLTAVQWAVSGYLLAVGTGLAATSYAARRYGIRAVYLACMAGFIAASVGCALAGDVHTLITLRVVQGLAGAPLVPLSMTLLMGRRSAGSGGPPGISPAVGLALFLAPALGPTVGGTLITLSGWPLIFLINLPLGLAGMGCLLLASRGLIPDRREPAPFDPIGSALLAAGLVAVLYASSRVVVMGWDSPRTWPFAVAGLLLLAGYAPWARRREHPAVDLGVLRHTQAVLALTLAVAASVVAFAAVFLVPVLAQQVQGHSALATGLALLPQGVMLGLGTGLSERITQRCGARAVVVGGFVLLALTTASLRLVGETTPLWVTAIILCGRGLAIGLVIQRLLRAALQHVELARMADANTLFSIVERLGGSVGVSSLSSLYAVQAASHGGLAGFHDAVLVLTVIATVAAVLALRLGVRSGPDHHADRDAGDDAAGGTCTPRPLAATGGATR
jgi:EmrB/QacA subfamily drug resistance transporter